MQQTNSSTSTKAPHNAYAHHSKSEKSKWIIGTAVVVIVLIIIGYFGYNYYEGRLNQAYQQGGSAALTYVYQQSLTCQPLPLTLNNQTIDLIAEQCLQQQAAAQQNAS